MQPTNIEGVAKDVAAAVMGNTIIQFTFSPGAEQDGFESDLRIELTRVLASNPALVRTVPLPVLPLQDRVMEVLLLAIFDRMGGHGDSSEYKHHWLNFFTSDERHGVEDTFNRCNANGWLHTTTNSDIDASTTTLTPAGRAYLAEMRMTPAATGDVVRPAEIMPAPDTPIELHGGQVQPAMFFFSIEGHNLFEIAQEHGFDCIFNEMFGHAPTIEEDEALEAAYVINPDKVLTDWQPKTPDGWQFAGKWHGEEGPVSCFLRQKEVAR